MTTLPLRLNDPQDHCGIRPSLKTILEQSDVDYEVHLNIPYSHRFETVVMPEWMAEWQEKYPHLKVFRCPDFGPITKIYPTLQRITDLDTVIITVDDDLYYVDGFIKSHLSARQRYPNCALGFAGITSINESLPADDRGVHPTGQYYFAATLPEDTRVRILEGYKTVSYSRSYFEEDFNYFAFTHWADDLILSAYMGYKNIKKIVLRCEDDTTDYSQRVESYPVIGHVPISGEVHGCNVFRNNSELTKITEAVSNNWYRLGYLER